MSAVTTKTVKDSINFTIYKKDLNDKKVGEKLETQERAVAGSNGLKWWIEYYPAGEKRMTYRYVSVRFGVNKNVTGKLNVTLAFSSTSNYGSPVTYVKGERESIQFATKHLLPNFIDVKATMTCSIEFEVPVLNFQAPRLYLHCDHAPTDFTLLVGSQRIPAHKGLLSLLSPIFYAMQGARNGEVTIMDYGYGTVKTAIDICYGKNIEELPAEMVLSILRFAHKYVIKAITDQLEDAIKTIISQQTVCAIALYANEFLKDDLLAECREFLKAHLNSPKMLENFTGLPPKFAVELLKATFEFKSEVDVLNYAHKHSIKFVTDYLESKFKEEPLKLSTIRPLVKHTFRSVRDDIKKTCGTLLNKHFPDMVEEFNILPADKSCEKRDLENASKNLKN